MFATACSGIEGASVALLPLGWKCAFVAEIEPYCCHLLHQKYGASRPHYMPRPEDADNEEDAAERRQNIKLVSALPKTGMPNLGDITQADPSEFRGLVDVLIAGIPCQPFSVAGLRKSIHDKRNLTECFVEFADAIDPRYIVFENVPGIFSADGNPFGCFLGALAGADSPLVPAKEQRWTDFGVVDGPKRRIAWRVMDAQWYGLAQRRERVFVVASTRNAAHPIEILLNKKGVWGNSTPRRETWQETAGTLNARTGGLGTDFELGGGLQVMTSHPHLPTQDAVSNGAARVEDKIR
jgi:DNA (cytosine-5)-methyltransferase 1